MPVPPDKISKLTVPEPSPGSQVDDLAQIRTVSIPTSRDRDRLLFHLIYTTGLRIGEALSIEVDDLDLTRDETNTSRSWAKAAGGARSCSTTRASSRCYGATCGHAATGTAHCFAEKNHVGGPLRYASARQLWANYRAKAQVNAAIHQLRHVHATGLVNAGVSLETIRRRLGHPDTQTIQRYAEQKDATADAEIRSWRRGTTTRLPGR